MKNIGQRGQGKQIYFELKTLKKLCVKFYGLGFIFTTPRIRAQLMENMNDFINDLTNEICNLEEK